jgi:large subunit ribosomal protein L7/L12
MNRLSIILADANTMTKIDNLIEELGKLTVVEAGELSKRLEKEWGLNLEAFMGATAQAQEPAKEESVLVDVILTGYPADKKISVLKKVREFIDMGLLEAKNFVEAIPKPVKEDIDKEEAEKVKKALEEAGAVVELK